MSASAFPSIMGIVNVTPDSFSDGGRFYVTRTAVEHALQLIGEGADYLDIGGESTRPGAGVVSADEEIRRVVPVIEGIRKHDTSVPISIDTRKSAVAQAAIDAGATMVNDVSGLGYDANLANVAAKAKVPVILMHSRDNPQTMQNAPHYLDVVAEVKSELTAQITLARSMNITNIYADVGIGFAKTAEHNWQLLKNHSSFLDLGVPLVLGISRKSFLGKLFNIDEPSDRDIVTALLHSLLLDSGAKIIRVHNVFHLSALRLLQRTLLSSET